MEIRMFKPPLLWSAGAGLLAGLALILPALWWLIFVGLAVLLQVICNTSMRHAVLAALIFGTIKGLIVLSWVFYAYPIEWIFSNSAWWQLLLIAIYVVPCAFLFGLGTACFGYVYAKYLSRNTPTAIILGAFIWLFGELMGALLVSVASLGPGSYFQTYFSFGFIGYAVAEHTLLLQVAQLYGVYALTLLTFIITSGGLLVTKRSMVVGVALLCLCVLTAGIPFPLGSKAEGPGTAALIATEFPERSPTESLANVHVRRKAILEEAVQAAAVHDPAHVVLPEDSRFTTYNGGTTTTLALIKETFRSPVVFIDSARTLAGKEIVQRAYIYDTSVDQVYEFDKQYLVPQGEYVPWFYLPLIKLLVRDAQVQQTFADISYRPGIDQRLVELPDYVPSVLFCFESVAPVGVRAATAGRSDVPFVAHVVSHAWFNGEPHLLWHQLDAMLRVQAVWNQVPIVQVANEAPTKAYLPDGSREVSRPLESGSGWSLSIW